MFDHTIPLNLDERMTIIHGENGVGKTILLEMIESVSSPVFDNKLTKDKPFASFTLNFDNDAQVRIKKAEEIKLVYCEGGIQVLEKSLFIDHGKKEKEEKVLVLWDNPLTFSSEENNFSFKSSLIGINRIEKPGVLMVKKIILDKSTELSEKITQALRDYADFSHKDDFGKSSLSYLKKDAQTATTAKDIITKLKEIQQKNDLYTQIGLFEKPDERFSLESINVEELDLTKTALFLEKAERKLAVLDDIAKKINLFLSILNKRLRYKKLFVNKNGMNVVNDIAQSIALNDLSSGEQHEIVMIYDLIFNTLPDTLVMIDEPELSLHPAWQIDFLDDMKKIIDLCGFDLLVATHSPQIINDKWHLAIELGRNA